MNNIINIEENLPHKVSETICLRCFKRWIAVRPTSVLLKDMDCPYCKRTGLVIETREIIQGDDYNERL